MQEDGFFLFVHRWSQQKHEGHWSIPVQKTEGTGILLKESRVSSQHWLSNSGRTFKSDIYNFRLMTLNLTLFYLYCGDGRPKCSNINVWPFIVATHNTTQIFMNKQRNCFIKKKIKSKKWEKILICLIYQRIWSSKGMWKQMFGEPLSY